MNLEEAIEILRTHPIPQKTAEDRDFREAIILGIEALKFRQHEKDAGYLDLDDLLPGETTD